MRARPSSTPFSNLYSRSGPSSVRPQTIPICSPPPSASSMKGICAARINAAILALATTEVRSRRSFAHCVPPQYGSACLARAALGRLPLQREFSRVIPGLARRAVGAGQHYGAELWRRLGQQGFRGSLRAVTEWATRRRWAETIEGGALNRTPSARTLARLMTIAGDKLSRSDTVLVAAIESGIPSLVEAREIIAPLPGHDPQEGSRRTWYWRERAGSSLGAASAIA